MLDSFNRKIDYLRVSVIDRCNHRCIYCMPKEGVPLKKHDDILSYEQIVRIVDESVKIGIEKVRITGGEPLIRRNIEHLVSELHQINGIKDLCMTTNGTLLGSMAEKLSASGLGRINISLDTLDADIYSEITRGGNINEVLTGIDAALDAGLTPVKINMVIFENTTHQEISDMENFCSAKGISLQKIMQFSLYDRKDLKDHFKTERPPRCKLCSRLRLTADGYLKPCLFADKEIKVDFNNIRQSLEDAVAAKPKSGSACRNRTMSAIGG